MNYYSMEDIKIANENAGQYFFSPSAMRFFKSRVGDTVFQGIGGIYFVTSEKFDYKSPRNYTVRQFSPKTGHINTASKFNEMSYSQARARAKYLSEQEDEG